MDEKLHKILMKINLDEKYFNLFYNAKILKNSVNELNNTLSVEIYNENDISIELYDELESKFSDYFDGANVKLKIINETDNSDNFESNLKVLLLSHKYPNFEALESNLEFYNNSIVITTINDREREDIEKEASHLEKMLSIYGTNFTYQIEIDETKRVEIDEKIENESIEIMNKPYVTHEEKKQVSNFPRRRKKDVDEKTIFGNRISEEEAITKIHSIVGENEGIVIEAKVFGNKEFVPSSKAFKILTLKVTDFSDSILAKIFVRDDDVYDDLLKKTKDLEYFSIGAQISIPLFNDFITCCIDFKY